MDVHSHELNDHLFPHRSSGVRRRLNLSRVQLYAYYRSVLIPLQKSEPEGGYCRKPGRSTMTVVYAGIMWYSFS
jgi:hypothetical protein